VIIRQKKNKSELKMAFDNGSSSSLAIFLTFIKKKEDGSWEKPSKKESRLYYQNLIS
jgi:hypothetical protein